MKYWLTIGLALGARTGGACDCLPPSMQQAYQAAACVVQARVLALRDTVHYDLYSQPVRAPFRSGYQPVLRVEKILKGQLPGRRLTLAVADPQGGCNYYFQTGATYLVFLYREGKTGYSTSSCQPNFLLTDTAALRLFQQVRR